MAPLTSKILPDDLDNEKERFGGRKGEVFKTAHLAVLTSDYEEENRRGLLSVARGLPKGFMKALREEAHAQKKITLARRARQPIDPAWEFEAKLAAIEQELSWLEEPTTVPHPLDFAKKDLEGQRDYLLRIQKGGHLQEEARKLGATRWANRW